MLRLFALWPLVFLVAASPRVEHRSMGAMEVKRLKVNDAELAYVEEGVGETVVFVHGAAGDWRTWDSLRPLIADKYRYVALSRRYHYPNAWPDDGKNYSVMQHVEDVAAFIRALHVGKVHLVGGSYGGRVAGYVALKYPELLRSVVLSEPGLIALVTEEGKSAREFLKEYAAALAIAKEGDVRRAAVFLFDAVQDDKNAFEKASPDRQQRWLENARTLIPMDEGADPPPVTCEQLAGFKVLGCLPKGTQSAEVPGAPHIWYPVHPAAGAKAILGFIAKH